MVCFLGRLAARWPRRHSSVARIALLAHRLKGDATTIGAVGLAEKIATFEQVQTIELLNEIRRALHATKVRLVADGMLTGENTIVLETRAVLHALVASPSGTQSQNRTG